MASEGWGNAGGGEGARLALCSARARQSLSGASLYSRSFMLLSSILVSNIARTHSSSLSSAPAVPLSLRLYSSRPPRRDYDSSSSSSYGRRGGRDDNRSRAPARRYDNNRRLGGNNWGNSGGASWGGGDGGFQSGGGGYGGQRSTACFNCGQG